MSRIGIATAALAVGCLAAGCTAEGSEGGAAEGPGAVSTGEARLADAAQPSDVTIHVYKSPTCGCCAQWVEHLRSAGFTVAVEDREDLGAVKSMVGVPAALQSCHTATAGDYVFEGHVPADAIARFLDEAPDARGLAVPGMPVGSPGMEMDGRVDPYDIIIFDEDGASSVYESRR